jgi:hypothetical protein
VISANEDLPVKVYEGESADVVFLESLLVSSGIEVVRAGRFFGPGNEVYVRRRDEEPARAILADFEANRSGKGGDVLRGKFGSS